MYIIKIYTKNDKITHRKKMIVENWDNVMDIYTQAVDYLKYEFFDETIEEGVMIGFNGQNRDQTKSIQILVDLYNEPLVEE